MQRRASRRSSLHTADLSLLPCVTKLGRSVAMGNAHAQAPFLGQRSVDEKGKPGPYQWMSYKAAAEARTDVGSGLLHFGLSSGCTLGLYSVNCRGALAILPQHPCPAAASNANPVEHASSVG